MSHNSELKFSLISVWRAFPLNYRSWLWFSVSPMPTIKCYFLGHITSATSPALRGAFSVLLWNIVEDFHYNTQSYFYRWCLLGTGTNKGWTFLGYFSFMHVVDSVSDLVSSVLTNISSEPSLRFAVEQTYLQSQVCGLQSSWYMFLFWLHSQVFLSYLLSVFALHRHFAILCFS